MTNKQKVKVKKLIKRRIKFITFIAFNFSGLALTFCFGSKSLLLIPFIILFWMFFMFYIAEKFGYMRNIRTPEQIKFYQEHELIDTYYSYRDDDIKVYRNKLTRKIVEK